MKQMQPRLVHNLSLRLHAEWQTEVTANNCPRIPLPMGMVELETVVKEEVSDKTDELSTVM